MHKYWFAQLFTILTLSGFIMSCSQGENDPIIPTTNVTENSSFSIIATRSDSTETDEDESDLEDECYTFVYPITLINPNNSSQEVSGDQELYDYIDQWLIENPESEEFPTFQFPIDITLADGSVRSINSEEELCDILHECYGDDEDYEDYEEEYEEEELEDIADYINDCFDISFPIELIIDSSNVTVNNIEELYNLGESEPNSAEIIYPIELTDIISGEVLVIENDEDLEEALISCYTDEEDVLGSCFDFVYPIEYITDDSVTTSINSLDELFMALEELEYDQEVELVFPIDITFLADGSTITTEDEDDLEDAVEEICGEFEMD